MPLPPSGSLLDLIKLTDVSLQVNKQPAPQQQLVSVIRSYPWGDFPLGHIPFDTFGVLDTVPAAPSGDTDIPFSPVFQVPNGYDGVIDRYSINFTGGGFNQGGGDLVWKILRNMQPIRNFDSITSERGTVQSPREIDHIRIYSGDIITIVINHVANDALNGATIVSLSGYFYPQELYLQA